LTDIAAMPQQLPPEGVSVGVEITSEAISDIANHAKKLTGAVKATFIRKHEKRFAEVWNEGTNTIDSTLKQDVLVDGSLRAFAKVMANLSAFATKFENVPLRGSAKVQVPFFDLQTAASTDFVAANGYVAGDTTTDNREVTINKRKYQAIRFTSEELRRQPYLMLKEHFALNGEKLAYDIFLDILSAITNANYGAAALTGLASAFDSDDLADLDKVATDAQWPAVGRYIFLNSAFDNALKKDDTMKLALNFGGTEVIRDGRIPNVFGFNYVTNPNIPANGENLAGFIAFKSALLIATAPIQPAEEVLRDGTQ
jgi:hypothetical protein